MKSLRIAILASTAAAVLWCGWVLLQRHLALRDWEARMNRKAHPAPSAQFNRIYGGSGVRILNFYASAGAPAAGEPALLCYGVINASSVRMDPPVAGVYPTLSKCVEVRPEKDTRYMLTAKDAAGHSVSASLVLPVKPGPGEKAARKRQPGGR